MIRENELLCKGEKGIIEIIKMMHRASKFRDWTGYDEAVKKLGDRLF